MPDLSIRVELPYHLKNLAKIQGEVALAVPSATLGAVLETLEERYPVLRGAIRDHGTLKRRPFVRYYACEEDFSLKAPETPLPEAIVSGKEPLMIIGAVAGG